MGGRQSVQTDLHRRPRASSAVAPSRDAEQANTSRAGSTSAADSHARRNLGESTSDSDEEQQPSSLPNHASTSETRRTLRFLPRIPHHTRDGVRRLPVLRFSQDVLCPVCQKTIPSDEAEVHLLMCLTRPRLTYNEDILSEEKGECAICLEEMVVGDNIARLPCFCIYHKHCIDEWFQRKNCCPEHPGDD